MSISFEKLEIGSKYDRPFLAALWGYKGFQAISRGVVTPSATNYIILFVTKEKQHNLTQYKDFIEQEFLHWEGEKGHGSDDRIVNSSNSNDQIYLFYRDLHHSAFVYYGEIFLEEHIIWVDRPSQFLFRIGEKRNRTDLLDDLELHEQEFKTLERTEQESIVKSRIGQGKYRDKLILFWGGCSVTGLKNISLLRASHIKPWRDCSNYERLDPMNGLLLHPTLDHLFDSGLITFDENGAILISEQLTLEDAEILSVKRNNKLRETPDKLMQYMRYHREHVFKPK